MNGRSTIFLFVTLFLTGYYFVFYLSFLKLNTSNAPILKERLGSVLWKAAHNPKREEFHTYCYYPKSRVSYAGIGDGYLIKRVESFKDCLGWYGIINVSEPKEVSEKDKTRFPTNLY